MSFLTKALHLNYVKGTVQGFARYLSTQSIQNKLSNQVPRIIENPWIYKQNTDITTPRQINSKIIEFPNGLHWVVPLTEPPKRSSDIEAPSPVTTETPKEAARLIVIRRKKMKKHKLKKLRKRMRFEWGKRRQKRELRKEKAFQAVLIQQCKDAEVFSAEQYVQERLDKIKQLSEQENVQTWSRTPMYFSKFTK